MTWVMIRTKLPPMADDTVQPARPIKPPPICSIHWAVASTIERYAARQRKHIDQWGEEYGVGEDDYLGGIGGAGAEPNWVGAKVIRWCGSDVRIFPHEFSVCSARNLPVLIYGDDGDGAYDLIPSDDLASVKLLAGVLDGESRPIYEAALLDGANEAQAIATALEQDWLDATGDDLGIAPLGWYRPRPEYAQYFDDDVEAVA